MKTDPLYVTSNTTPEVLLNEIQGTPNIGTNILISTELPSMNLLTNEREEIFSDIQVPEFERKDRMCTKVIDIDEPTLRTYFPTASNIEPITHDLFFSTITPLESIVPERERESYET